MEAFMFSEIYAVCLEEVYWVNKAIRVEFHEYFYKHEFQKIFYKPTYFKVTKQQTVEKKLELQFSSFKLHSFIIEIVFRAHSRRVFISESRWTLF